MTAEDQWGNISSCTSEITIQGPDGYNPCNLDPCASCDNPLPNTWTGDIDSDRNTAGNWSLGVPTVCHAVIINFGSVLIYADTDAECFNIEIAEGASLDEELGYTLTVMACGTN